MAGVDLVAMASIVDPKPESFQKHVLWMVGPVAWLPAYRYGLDGWKRSGKGIHDGWFRGFIPGRIRANERWAAIMEQQEGKTVVTIRDVAQRRRRRFGPRLFVPRVAKLGVRSDPAEEQEAAEAPHFVPNLRRGVSTGKNVVALVVDGSRTSVP